MRLLVTDGDAENVFLKAKQSLFILSGNLLHPGKLLYLFTIIDEI